MAKCKLCKKIIAEGTKYCTDCTDKKDLIANESYLDDLLNSVQMKATTASDIYKKKKEERNSDSPATLSPLQKDTSYSIDLDDLSDFEQFDIMKELDDPIVISDEELYGDTITSDIENNYEDDLSAVAEDAIDDTISSVIQEQTGNIGIEHNIDNEFLDMDESKVHSDTQDEQLEPDLDELLNQLDLSADNYDDFSDTDNDEESLNEVTEKYSLQEEKIASENELLDLLNQFDPANPIEDDMQAISDLLGGIDEYNKQEKEYPEDVGDVFSEALEAISDLNDPGNGIKYISQEPEEIEEMKVTKGKKNKDKKNKDKKEGIFTKLFANIDDEGLDPKKKKASEEAALAKEAKKKKKKTKDKKGLITNQEDADEVPGKGRKEAETQEDKKKDKKAKKEKKKRIEILDDEVDEGHINRVGASIVFVIFGVLVMLLLVSTNIFSYSLSIKNATNYFGRQRYTQAYNEVYGIELKDEDIELYDKIMTVMYVNKQLNSYNNYYHMRKFPEALDSLLKGLQRYDKYIELATMLGIKTDLDYVRNQIVAELYSVFSLSEDQAINIINSDSQAKYSISVYDVVLENITYY